MSGAVTDWIKTYTENIVPKLEKLEIERKKRLQKALLFLFCSLFISIICAFVCTYFAQKQDNYAFVVFDIILFGSPFFALFNLVQENRDFIEYAKKKCIYDCISAFGGIHWTPGVIPLSPDEAERSGLFSKWTHYITDDDFTGNFNGLKYEIIETKLFIKVVLAVSRSGTIEVPITAFKGVVIIFPCNKKIGARTIVATQGDNNILGLPTGTVALGIGILIFIFFPYIVTGTWAFDQNILVLQLLYVAFPLAIFIWQVLQTILEKFKLQDLKNIKLEDSVWNKRFKVYSTDEVEARYLVTTAFMERFLKLNTAFGTKKAKCSFYENKIMFAISTKKNLFEVGNLFSPMSNPKHMQKFFHEYKSIVDMIEYFKLYEETGL